MQDIITTLGNTYTRYLPRRYKHQHIQLRKAQKTWGISESLEVHPTIWQARPDASLTSWIESTTKKTEMTSAAARISLPPLFQKAQTDSRHGNRAHVTQARNTHTLCLSRDFVQRGTARQPGIMRMSVLLWESAFSLIDESRCCFSAIGNCESCCCPEKTL